MMAGLRELVPGPRRWPTFRRNRSEQFEARFVLAEVTESPSILFRGMTGSRMPIATAHGEGLAAFDSPAAQARALTCLRFVDNCGAPVETYPLNPNGSPAESPASPPPTAGSPS